MSKMKFNMLILALPVSMMGADQKPYHMDPDQIITKKELFCGNENANKRQQVLDAANQFIDETGKKLKEANFLQKFEDFRKERKVAAIQLANSTANGDESLKKGILTVLEETLKKDPQFVEVDDSYSKAYHNANKEANELQAKLEKTENEVNQKAKAMEDLKKQLEVSKKETADTKAELNQAKAEVANWQKQKSNADQIIGQQRQQIDELKSKESDAQKEISRLTEDIKKADKTIQDNELKNNDIQNELKLEKVNHQHDNENNNAKIKELVAQIKAMKAQLAAQKEDFEKLLVEKDQTCLDLLAQEKKAAYNRGKIDQQAEDRKEFFQHFQAMIMSVQQLAILASQQQSQDQSNNAGSQGSNTAADQK